MLLISLQSNSAQIWFDFSLLHYDFYDIFIFWLNLSLFSFVISSKFVVESNKMSSKHLRTGSECPPLAGKMRIYSMRFCPYAQRALLTASAKEIPHDVVNCNLVDKPEWLFEKNPEGKVPVLEIEDGIVYESLIIADYLDDKYSNFRPLQSSNALQKALDRLEVQRFNGLIRLYYKLAGSTTCSDDEVKLIVNQFVDELSTWDAELKKRGTKYFFGDEQPGMLDYMIWPWIERLPILQLFFPTQFIYADVKKNLSCFARWEDLMLKDDIIQRIFLSSDIHYAYTLSKNEGKSNYDLLD